MTGYVNYGYVKNDWICELTRPALGAKRPLQMSLSVHRPSVSSETESAAIVLDHTIFISYLPKSWLMLKRIITGHPVYLQLLPLLDNSVVGKLLLLLLFGNS